ncbi:MULTISPECIES: hypothetical protein [unclassified Pseudoalteromonas]|uniref:hypothetical protein n=1 Tax=unclassified Pseudoalteromonas TaxID=194690 RepID=UPI0016038847|nr:MULTISPECIES: hypothetical protein [unclassified Pseudoalteromonas]MBB1333820.1 hypothetical protein [Pseudoalteromonas sp. SR41-6]MBB1342704.1 hypothetical protein [Pseudoalteromonas sp. SR45-6]MBB1459541.1 hypothetical protein [Pseudoalteromonas sp. SG41-8]
MTVQEKGNLASLIKASLQDKSKTTPTDPLVSEKVEDSKADRELKKSYANWFIKILIGQLIVMNIVFFCVGFGWLAFDEWSLNLYMGSTLAEVFGVILVITKNLFPTKPTNR